MTGKLARWALPGGALVSLALLPMARPGAPWGTGVLLLGGAGGLCYWVARRVLQDRALAWIVLGAIALRAALSLVFYSVSQLGLPLARDLQLAGGFWIFAADAVSHHTYAIRILEAWRDGTEIPAGLTRGWYFLTLAATYKVTGIHPLHGAWVNSIVGGLSPLLAFSIANRLGGRLSGRVSAALVAFWPSLVLWSTQLAKEELTVLFVLLALYFAVALCAGVAREVTRNGPTLGWRELGLLMGASAATAAIAMGRPLYALALALSVLAVFFVVSVVAVCRRRLYLAASVLAAALALCGASLAGQAIDPLYLFSPRTPWVGHYALGLGFLERGNRIEAEREFRRALDLEPGFVQAREKLAILTGGSEESGPASSVDASRTSSGPPRSGPRSSTGNVAALVWGSLERASQLGGSAERIPETLSSLRRGQATAPGGSPIDPGVTFSSFGDVLAYLPTAVVHFFLSPFPWDVFRTGGVAGRLKTFSILEMGLLYCLIPFAIVGSRQLLRSRNLGAWVLLLYLVLGCLSLGWTMVNMGSLFRYRLPFLLVVMVFASIGVSLRWLRTAPAPARHSE